MVCKAFFPGGTIVLYCIFSTSSVGIFVKRSDKTNQVDFFYGYINKLICRLIDQLNRTIMGQLRYFLGVSVLLFVCILQAHSTSEYNLPLADGSYNIMILLPYSSVSHRNCFVPLAEALGARGHKVTILSPLPPACKHPNVVEINHGIDVVAEFASSMFDIRAKGDLEVYATFKVILPKLMAEFYNVTIVKELYNRRHEFDLFIIDEMFNEPAYPFLEGKKYIGIATGGHSPMSSSVLGNVLNPAYVLYTQNMPRPLSFMNRAINLFWHVFLPIFWRHIEIVPEIQKVATELFPNLPPLLEIERDGLVLVLSNSHFSYDHAIPVLPSQVEIGGMHCHPGKKLPNDLQSWIDGAGSDGVVYFSIGSVAAGSSLPKKYKDLLLKAFSKLKQRVIWKFEEDFPNLPKNVISRKWLPQQDILAHPNVKLFITHGGLLSSQEAIYHATPMLALPIFADQPRNAAGIKAKGFGTFLIWEELTVESVFDAINEVIYNQKYKTKISSVSASFRDQQTTPLERAVWWTEYVIRHKGAPQLRSPAADLSWVEYLMIDIILTIHVILFAIYWIAKKLLKKLYSVIYHTKSQTKKKRE